MAGRSRRPRRGGSAAPSRRRQRLSRVDAWREPAAAPDRRPRPRALPRPPGPLPGQFRDADERRDRTRAARNGRPRPGNGAGASGVAGRVEQRVTGRVRERHRAVCGAAAGADPGGAGGDSCRGASGAAVRRAGRWQRGARGGPLSTAQTPQVVASAVAQPFAGVGWSVRVSRMPRAAACSASTGSRHVLPPPLRSFTKHRGSVTISGA